MPSKSKVYFFFETTGFSLTKRKDLKKFIEKLFVLEKTGLDNLNYIFCSDKRLLQINKEYLNHDYYTDIITFDLSDRFTGNIGKETVAGAKSNSRSSKKIKGRLVQSAVKTSGEIYISIDRVRDNAKVNGVSFKEELHRVIFHGALHLCGYKDKKPADKKLMTQKENQYLAKYGL